MTIHFSYTPPSPENLSGPAFISQTEKALNELGSHIETIQSTGDEALATARNALTTANNAAITADDANTAAQNAQEAADAAQAAADAAGETADDALETALDALDTAANAESKADSVEIVADTALEKAGTAEEKADDARDRADTARQTAEVAVSAANAAWSTAYTALGEYIVVAADNEEGTGTASDRTEEDADAYFESPEKLYFTGTNLVNFPLEAPFYCDVHVTDDGKNAFQRVFTGDQTWTREATVETVTDADTGETEAKAVWTQWAAVTGSVYPEPKQYELCEYYFFRSPVLREGFQPAQGGLLADAATRYPEAWQYLQTEEGQRLCVTEAAWQAMTKATFATLLTGATVGWNGIGGAPYFVQDITAGTLRLPDLRGMYAEAAGFDSLGVGGVHGDGVRRATGALPNMYPAASMDQGSGVLFFNTGQSVLTSTITAPGLGYGGVLFDSSRGVPVANKNQPRAWGALACVYLGKPAV